jgi:extracellular factor (EF) 3-hydroxypalmitic acid methyl ester biosynthesis protein
MIRFYAPLRMYSRPLETNQQRKDRRMHTETENVIGNETLEAAMEKLDRATSAIRSGQVSEGMGRVFDGLCVAREQMSSAQWTEFGEHLRRDHPLGDLVRQDPMTRRAIDKPRGYAGDAVMMDLLYGLHSSHVAAAEASLLGRDIYRFIRGSDAAAAVRYRRKHIAELIDKVAMERPHASVLAVASGHLREAELSESLASGRLGRLIALDADVESLREASTRYAYLGVETIDASVRHILARRIGLASFDLVYAAGLYDYLSVTTARRLTERLVDMLNPGGQLLIANFMPQLRDRGYMETFMDWNLIYRDEYDLALLVEGINSIGIRSYDIYTDPARAVVYSMIRK